MTRNIKLNSSDWCDMIFEGKNKSYGAYALRRSSSKRHIAAFVVSIVFISTVIAIPSLLNAVQPDRTVISGFNDTFTVTQLSNDLEDEKIEDIIPQTVAPPPPIIDSRMFTPPVVTADEKVDETKEMDAQNELLKDKRIISIATIDNGNTTGVDIKEILEEQRKITNTPPVNVDKIHDVVEVMPQFPGGENELLRYLNNNMKYPAIAAENNIQGRVVLRFVVGKDGGVSSIEVLQALNPACDKEAIRVVNSMPRWIPGQQNGHHVPVYFTLPILFRLQ